MEWDFLLETRAEPSVEPVGPSCSPPPAGWQVSKFPDLEIEIRYPPEYVLDAEHLRPGTIYIYRVRDYNLLRVPFSQGGYSGGPIPPSIQMRLNSNRALAFNSQHAAPDSLQAPPA